MSTVVKKHNISICVDYKSNNLIIEVEKDTIKYKHSFESYFNKDFEETTAETMYEDITHFLTDQDNKHVLLFSVNCTDSQCSLFFIQKYCGSAFILNLPVYKEESNTHSMTRSGKIYNRLL